MTNGLKLFGHPDKHQLVSLQYEISLFAKPCIDTIDLQVSNPDLTETGDTLQFWTIDSSESAPSACYFCNGAGPLLRFAVSSESGSG
jgi:hypothetical protein